jgi:hypothetical protein
VSVAAARRWSLPRVPHRYRRVVAAVLVGVAGAVAVHAAAPPPPGVPVVVAARDLAAGERLAADDVTTVVLPADAVPDGAVGADGIDGARVASAVRRGEPVTDVRLAGSGTASALPPGQVAVPVRLAPETAPWLAVGQRLRLHATSAPGAGLSGAAATGPGVPVLLLDLADDPATSGGVLGPVPSERTSVEALVQVDHDEAGDLLGGGGEPLRAVLLGS